MDAVTSSWETRWFGISDEAREMWTDGGHVWDDITLARLQLSIFLFLLTFVDFSTFRKPQDHVAKS